MKDNLEFVLNEVKKCAPVKEPTLFAVGGRGYYENPASDLLAFFLKPDSGHGLGNLFLSTYLECMKEDHRQLDVNQVDIRREVKTEDGSKIDLRILGPDWCLIIENKIRHLEANPFPSYESHAKALREKTKLYSVLSPSGFVKKEGKTEDWKGVSYPDYCNALRKKMPELACYNHFSKWQLFAHEFILHLKNETDNRLMNPDDATLVEKNAAEFIRAQKLLQQYPSFLCSVVQEKIQEEIGYNVEVVSRWAILIKSPERWGKAHIAFRPPTEDDDGERGNKSGFDITIYPDEGELKCGRASEDEKKLLEGMRYFAPSFCWLTVSGFKDRDEAIKDLIPRIKLIERPLNC